LVERQLLVGQQRARHQRQRAFLAPLIGISPLSFALEMLAAA
jgi:hypothetical protein